MIIPLSRIRAKNARLTSTENSVTNLVLIKEGFNQKLEDGYGLVCSFPLVIAADQQFVPFYIELESWLSESRAQVLQFIIN